MTAATSNRPGLPVVPRFKPPEPIVPLPDTASTPAEIVVVPA